MARYAILLAAEEYAHYKTTPFCHADASALTRVLVDHCDYAPQHVLTRLLSLKETMLPTDILSDIEKLVHGAARGDTALFFFAGHGHVQNGEAFLLLPHSEPGRFEQTALPLRDIADRLRTPQRVNVRIFDACHSGLDVRDGGEQLDVQGFARTVLEDTPQGWVTLASCAEDEFSYPDPGVGNGIFTRALCDAIHDSPPGPIFPEALKMKVVERVLKRASQLAHRQTPVMNASLRGNVAIAERRAPTSATEPRTAPTATELLARAAALRSFPTLGGKEHRARLGEFINAVHALLDRKKSVVELGLTPTTTPPDVCDTIPQELKKRIVEDVSAMGVPSHEIAEASEEILEEPNWLARFSLEPAKGTGRYRTIYRVRQSKEWPPSWCSLQLRGDGYIPSFMILFYLIPFQAKALLIGQIASKGKARVVEHSWRIEHVVKDIVTLTEPPSEEVIEKLTASGLRAFADVCAAETEKRLAMLEQELITNTK
jgi:hypothetical protein